VSHEHGATPMYLSDFLKIQISTCPATSQYHTVECSSADKNGRFCQTSATCQNVLPTFDRHDASRHLGGRAHPRNPKNLAGCAAAVVPDCVGFLST
jgi:hypothetical protein